MTKLILFLFLILPLSSQSQICDHFSNLKNSFASWYKDGSIASYKNTLLEEINEVLTVEEQELFKILTKDKDLSHVEKQIYDFISYLRRFPRNSEREVSLAHFLGSIDDEGNLLIPNKTKILQKYLKEIDSINKSRFRINKRVLDLCSDVKGNGFKSATLKSYFNWTFIFGSASIAYNYGVEHMNVKIDKHFFLEFGAEVIVPIAIHAITAGFSSKIGSSNLSHLGKNAGFYTLTVSKNALSAPIFALIYGMDEESAKIKISEIESDPKKMEVVNTINNYMYQANDDFITDILKFVDLKIPPTDGVVNYLLDREKYSEEQIQELAEFVDHSTHRFVFDSSFAVGVQPVNYSIFLASSMLSCVVKPTIIGSAVGIALWSLVRYQTDRYYFKTRSQVLGY